MTCFQLFLYSFNILFKRFNFRFFGKNARQVVLAAAHNDTAGCNQITLERHYCLFPRCFFTQGQGACKVVRHQDLPKQFGGQVLIARSGGYMTEEQVVSAGVHCRYRRSGHFINRNETAASRGLRPEKINRINTGLHVLYKNILQRFSQDGFYRDLIFRLDFENVGHQAHDVGLKLWR